RGSPSSSAARPSPGRGRPSGGVPHEERPRLMPARRAALAWLEREHVFKWLPFVPVQALLVFLLLPFVLLVYLSLVSWRITRGVWWHAPFVRAANFTVAVRDDRLVWAVVRSFGFAAA